MSNIFNKVGKFILCDKMYVISSILNGKNIKIPKVIRVVSRIKMNKKQKFFRKTKDIELLDIKTPDNFNQCVHPDLIKLDNGQYIMVITPYPFGIDKFEKPVIYKSSNLINWKYCAGPIDSEHEGNRNHLSDAAIVQMNSGKLRCYYRENIYNDNGKKSLTNIYFKESKDLYHWNDKRLIVSNFNDEMDIISPSIQRGRESELSIYLCLKQGNKMNLVYTTDGNFSARSYEKIYCDEIIPENKIIWHVSHLINKDKDILLLTLADDFGGVNSELYIAILDGKTHCFESLEKLNIKEKYEDIKMEYRSAGIIEKNELYIVASVMFKNRYWGCILKNAGRY